MTKPKVETLENFMHAKERAACIVCQLPAEVRAQLGPPAAKRGFSRADQAAWLRAACGATKVTLDILNAHLNGRHDREDENHGQ